MLASLTELSCPRLADRSSWAAPTQPTRYQCSWPKRVAVSKTYSFLQLDSLIILPTPQPLQNLHSWQWLNQWLEGLGWRSWWQSQSLRWSVFAGLGCAAITLVVSEAVCWDCCAWLSRCVELHWCSSRPRGTSPWCWTGYDESTGRQGTSPGSWMCLPLDGL